MRFFTFLLAQIAFLFFARTLNACPQIEGLVDFNCDRRIRISAIGDSIVFGRGDLDNNNKGGWVLRLPAVISKRTARIETTNLGFPGITSGQLYSRLALHFSRNNSKIKRLTADSDVIIVSVGVNDFFDPAVTAGMTVRNIGRIVKLLRKQVGKNSGVQPFVIIAKPTPTTRPYQAPYLAEIGRLLADHRSRALPSYLRFDLLDPIYISVDGIHPFSAGYDELAKIAAQFLLSDGKQLQLALRPDADGDGVCDLFEVRKFGTDPKLKDTDGDGLSDGHEIFKSGTDPLTPDTEGDEIPDGDTTEAQ